MKKVLDIDKIKTKYGLEDTVSDVYFSASMDKALFISPFGWETMSNVYVYHLDTEELELVYKWDLNLCCKYADWESEETILAILGYTYGTINLGGDLYRVNTTTKQLELIRKFSDNIQVTRFKIYENKIKFFGKEYIDDEYICSKDYESSINLL